MLGSIALPHLPSASASLPRVCRAPNLGSSVHYVLVLGLVADTYNSNKIDIKNHTFIAKGENMLQGSGYIAWAIFLISYIKVLT